MDKNEGAPVMSGDKLEPAGVTAEMPGSAGGFSVAVFEAAKVPIGTPLYASPPATDSAGLVTQGDLNRAERAWERASNAMDASTFHGRNRTEAALAEVKRLRGLALRTAPAPEADSERDEIVAMVEEARQFAHQHGWAADDHSKPMVRFALAAMQHGIKLVQEGRSNGEHKEPKT